MPESSTSTSSQDIYAFLRRGSGRQVNAVDRYGCPIDMFGNVSFVEKFLCGELPLLRKLKSLNDEMNCYSDDKTYEFFSRKQKWAVF